MQQHCSQKHNWKSDKSRGGSKAQRARLRSNEIWVGGIWSQKFFQDKAWQKSFQVQVPDTGVAQERPKDGVDVWLGIYQDTLSRRNNQKVIQGPGNRYEVNPWLEMTGWIQHLTGFKQLQVLQAITPPGQDPVLQPYQLPGARTSHGYRIKHRAYLMIEEQAEAQGQ
ncbi:hypothetical protein BDZ85DRAFT_309724, partial [Elsinoe ampelina]